MILVHGYAPLPPLPSPSPFCVALETWLRMASFAYEVRPDQTLLVAPEGHSPAVTLDDGSVVSDGHQVFGILSQRPAVTLDRWLAPRDRATTTLVRRTVEDHLYYALLHDRWVEAEPYRAYKRVFYARYLPPNRWIAPLLARRNARRTLWMAGTLRHRSPIVHAGAEEDLDALVDVLGDKPFFCGDRPSTVDAVAYGVLASIHLSPIPGVLQGLLAARPPLAKFVERVRERYWP